MAAGVCVGDFVTGNGDSTGVAGTDDTDNN
jgi:hypothetical protein